ncbi:MAG TPA: hypothetical protein PLF26_02660 [Blastocatellia bacterium]|nr:hypothetical protein [Blastocatellia bacterium]
MARARQADSHGLPDEVEEHRDRMWRRQPEDAVSTAEAAERFVNDVGFSWALTDIRTPGPSLYIAVCGRREASMPGNVQKDPEASLAWVLKDEVMRRGRVFYAKLLRKRSTFVRTGLVPAFHAIAGIARKHEAARLSADARAVLKVLRKEWEMGTADLKVESGVRDRAKFTKALDELQACMKVVPGEVLYVPKFTYIWYLAEGRFAGELKIKVARDRAVTDIARAYLNAAGQTRRGELSSVTGLGRAEAGRANQRLVDEGFAVRLDTGVYRIASLRPGE